MRGAHDGAVVQAPLKSLHFQGNDRMDHDRWQALVTSGGRHCVKRIQNASQAIRPNRILSLCEGTWAVYEVRRHAGMQCALSPSALSASGTDRTHGYLKASSKCTQACCQIFGSSAQASGALACSSATTSGSHSCKEVAKKSTSAFLLDATSKLILESTKLAGRHGAPVAAHRGVQPELQWSASNRGAT